jgi:hypothetical protein
MTTVTFPRVRFFDKQFLRVDEFADEQLYQIAMRRRHNVAQHSWGIVVGLEIAQEEDALLVRPGLAIDGYGRELLLADKKYLHAEAFDELATDRLDIWLVYSRRDNTPAPSGYGGCGSDAAGDAYRSDEVPLILVERPTANIVDARRPPGVPLNVLNARVPVLSDNPNDLWRVYLGRIVRLPDGKFAIDSSQRTYVGLVGEVVAHPASAERVEIGKQSSKNEERVIGEVTYIYQKGEDSQRQLSRRFAIFIPEETVAGATEQRVTLLPRLDIQESGVIGIRGRTIIHGSLRISDGALVFTEPATFAPENAPPKPSLYRITAGSSDQLRIDLGAQETLNREFVIGFSTEDGSFTPCITLELKATKDGVELTPLVTINGDLQLNGEVLDGHKVPRALSPETINAILASFQSGVAAGNNSP